jgi:thioredoxin 1
VQSVSEHTFTHEVLEASTPVLVNFWAPWCGLCRRVSPFLTRLQAGWDHPLKIVGVNADQNLRLANRYRLLNLPTLLLFNQGNLVYRQENVQNFARFQVDMEQILDQCVRSSTREVMTQLELDSRLR